MVSNGTLEPAVVAPNVKCDVFLRGIRFYHGVNVRSVLFQSVGRQHGFSAQRAAYPVLLKAVHHAVNVNGMPACRHMRWFDGMEQILQADGAVGVELLGLAPMIRGRNTGAAIIAMHKIIITLHATNAALVAVVIISLNAIVKEVAHRAKISGELDATCIILACLGHGLLFIAVIAHHFFDGVPVHFMCLGVVVAVAAHIRFVATRRN
jgi:hypothetical protein